MKKKLVLGLVLIIVMVIWIQMNHKNQIQVCVIGDFSQSNTSSSVDVFRSVELAVEELNSGEEKYKLNRLNANTYENSDALRQDIIAGNYDIIIGPETSSRFMKYQDALSNLDVAVFLVAVSSDTINKTDDNLFRLASSIEDQTRSIVSALENQLNSNQLIVFYTSENIEFSKALATSVELSWNENNENAILYEVGDIGEREIQKQLMAVKTNGSVLIIAGPGQAGIMAQLVVKNNTECTILFPSWAFSDRTTEYISNLANEFYALSIPPPKKEGRHDAFSKSLYSLKGVQSNMFSIYAYESMYLVNHVIENTHSTDLEDIKMYIHQMDTYEGQFNNYQFQDFGDGSRGYSFIKIENGEYIQLMEKLK